MVSVGVIFMLAPVGWWLVVGGWWLVVGVAPLLGGKPCGVVVRGSQPSTMR